MSSLMETIHNIGIIPVIAIEDPDKAVPLAEALLEGGLPAAEITFRTAAAEEAIHRISMDCPQVLVGAGTILNVEQCDRAVAAGARFIVSPGYDPEVVSHCVSRNIPVLPGCVSASDLTAAYNAGLQYVKFFPAEPSGGAAFLRALAPVFPTLKFMPTGGVNTGNMLDYLNYDRVLACGGTWMVKKDLIEGEQWDQVTSLCVEAVKTMLGFELDHVGINCADPEGSEGAARRFATLFGFTYKPGNSSNMAGTGIECCKAPFLGAYGHLAIGTNNMDRAIYHLIRQGVVFDETTRKLDSRGHTKAIYLKGEIAGFAIHLVQK